MCVLMSLTDEPLTMHRDDDALAEQIAGFLEQFLNVFTELKGKNLYLAGESYAGAYFWCASASYRSCVCAGYYVPCAFVSSDCSG